MASVYLARDAELERQVAIKILAPHLASEPGFYERFVREARMAARVSHPNIVQVFDAGEEDDRPFIVMEYVRGRTLAEEVRAQGTFEAARVVDVALQICGGLELAHANGLVHRDVKPQNLLLRDDGVVKIVDFGIARAAEATNLTQIGSVLGTAAYLSPEQAAGEPVTGAADIYSLGVVLYELLTGRTPYDFKSLAELVVKQREETIPALREVEPSVPERLEAVIMRCLARNPDFRPRSAAELARDLASASPDPPTIPLPPDTGVQATNVETVAVGRRTRALPTPRRVSVRRNFGLRGRGAWLIVAVVGLILAIVIGFAVLSSDSPSGEPSNQAAQERVTPVPPAADPAAQARNLADWLRSHSSG
jgi:eukaryotic-like serine/threonine-protein kinase